MAQWNPQVNELFLKAREIAAPEERQAFLSQACAGDAGLLAQVEKLLQAGEQAGSFLESPAAVLGQTVRFSEKEGPGTVIGPYKLLEQIGEGGFGAVYLAEQTEPVRRKVAIKILKPGMDSRQVVVRFEAERQALAIMDHPHIARVFDGGATESGRPYFVMELVKGVPITQFCDEQGLSPRQRLELFLSVCAAVQHAHQKGIIHRDLKPSNVLVTRHDSTPVVKVIDFGVAKALGQELTDKTLFTGLAQMIGTPLYMSPEQAGMSDLDVDTRSDIYSLGVLLYELLTGTTPFTKERFKRAAYDEIRRIIREEDPPRPSTRLLESKESLPSISAQRQTEPAKLTQLVRGELDWIVMKALEKDRVRRYETANALSRDLQRYLSDEPVEASPPSATYWLRKFVKRNRASLSAAATIAFLLVAGTVISVWQAVRATRAEGLARKAQWAEQQRAEGEKHARQQAQAAADAEMEAKQQAQRDRDLKEEQRQYAQAIADFVRDDLLALTSVEGQVRFGEPNESHLDKDTTLRQLLDRAAEKLDQRRDLAPLIEAELRWMIGVNYRGQGEPGKAIPHLERCVALRKDALGQDHQKTLYAQNSLAVAYLFANQFKLAQPLLERTLELATATLGADHPDTLLIINNLVSSYHEDGNLYSGLPLLEEALKLIRAKLGGDHPRTLAVMHNLGSAYRTAGKLDLAIPLLDDTLRHRKTKLGIDHPDTLMTMHSLAEGYWAAGHWDLAQSLHKQTLKLRTDKLGLDHPDTLNSMNSLGESYRVAGKLDLAMPLLEQALTLRKARLGTSHPNTLISMNNLALGYFGARNLDKAVQLLEETLKLQKVALGADHPDVLTTMGNLAEGYRQAGRLELALPLMEETVKLSKARLGAEHESTLASVSNLATAYQAAGRLDLALPLLDETLNIMRAKLGVDHTETITAMNNLAVAYVAAGNVEMAAPLLEEAAAGIEKRQYQHYSAHEIIRNTTFTYERAGQLDKAESWRRRWLPVVKDRSGPDSLRYADELAALGLNLLTQQKWTEAELALRECLAILSKGQPDGWTTYNTLSLLGAALLGQKRYAEAEPLLLQGYEGMRARAKSIPAAERACLSNTIEWLVRLAQATGNADDTARWQKELEMLNATNDAKAAEKK